MKTFKLKCQLSLSTSCPSWCFILFLVFYKCISAALCTSSPFRLSGSLSPHNFDNLSQKFRFPSNRVVPVAAGCHNDSRKAGVWQQRHQVLLPTACLWTLPLTSNGCSVCAICVCSLLLQWAAEALTLPSPFAGSNYDVCVCVLISAWVIGHRVQLTAEALLTPACQPQRKTHFWVAGLVRLGNDTHTRHSSWITSFSWDDNCMRAWQRIWSNSSFLLGEPLQVQCREMLQFLRFPFFLTCTLLSSLHGDPSVDIGSECVAAGRNKVRIAYCSTLLSQATARAHMLLNNKDVMFPHLKTSCFKTSHRHTWNKITFLQQASLNRHVIPKHEIPTASPWLIHK